MDALNGKKYDVMRVLWEASEPLSAFGVQEFDSTLKMPTIRKALEDLLKEGIVQVSGTIMNGRVYARTYTPILKREDYLQENVRSKKIKPIEMMAALLEDETIDQETLQNLQELLEQKRKELDRV